MASRQRHREREIEGQVLRPESLMMSYGYDPELSEGALKCPIFQTSTFVFRTAEEGKAFFELAYGLREKRPAEEPGLIYSRINNPDLEILEERLALWDEAESCLAFSSGMAAIATTVLTFLRPGDVIIHSEPIYGGTDFLVHNILPKFGIKRVGFVAGQEYDVGELTRRAAEQGRVSVILIETPANPTNALVDIAAWAEAARDLDPEPGRRPLVAVDNTFLGPLWQQPLQQDADLVLYSLTKYVGGHGDVIAGACLGPEALISAVRGMRTILGTMADPWSGWLLLRSLETLKLRMTSQMKNARYVAEYLVDHPKVKSVNYLGLAEDGSAAEIYRRQCRAAGSTFGFELLNREADAFRLLNALRLVKLAVSLGGTESLAEHPATMTHSDIAPDDQLRMGITPGLVRISVGIEHPGDIIADLRQALEGV